MNLAIIVCPRSHRVCSNPGCDTRNNCFLGDPLGSNLNPGRPMEPLRYVRQPEQPQPAEPSDEPPFDLVDRCAQRIASWEDGCVWPDSWDSVDVARMRLDAKRVLLEARAWWTSHAAPATNGWTVIAPDGTRFEGQTPFSAASAATKHHGRSLYDPEKAAEFQALIADIRRESDDENARLVAEHGSLDCPACGGSGHIGDALARPAPSEAQDAARYRWLRDWPLMRWEIRYWTGQWWETMRGDEMDAAIDAALAAARERQS